jgi:hypothetical protein
MPYNYILQPALSRKTNVLKFGLSQKDNDDRVTSYGKETVVIRKIISVNPNLVENKLKIEFNKKFKLFMGNEYFEGNIIDMIETFDNVCEKYKNMRYDIPDEIVFDRREITSLRWKKIINGKTFKSHKEKMKSTFHKINTMTDFKYPLFDRRKITSHTKCYPYTTYEEWRQIEAKWIKDIYMLYPPNKSGCIITDEDKFLPIDNIETLDGWVSQYSYKGRLSVMIDKNMYDFDWMNEYETNKLIIDDIMKKGYTAYKNLVPNKRNLIKKKIKTIGRERKNKPKKEKIKSLTTEQSQQKKWFDKNIKKKKSKPHETPYLVRPLWEKFKKDLNIQLTFRMFKKILLKKGYKYRQRVRGINVKTGNRKLGACIMNMKFLQTLAQIGTQIKAGLGRWKD